MLGSRQQAYVGLFEKANAQQCPRAYAAAPLSDMPEHDSVLPEAMTGRTSAPPFSDFTLQNHDVKIEKTACDNSPREYMCLNAYTVTHTLVEVPPTLCTRLASGPLTTHQISTQSVQPYPRYGMGVRTCACTPPLTSV